MGLNSHARDQIALDTSHRERESERERERERDSEKRDWEKG